MALSDCPECWETPCVCGYEYKNDSLDYLIKMRDMFQKLIDEKSKPLGFATVIIDPSMDDDTFSFGCPKD